ncbi:MAG TPA: sulfatase [Pirellulaceae bacterium]|nr:sulfatase [Pirellulaceae bacterium]
MSSVVLSLCLAANAAGEQKPNIVLIFADDLGINDLSCYGRQDQRTPRLDRMAAEGVRFTCAYCSQPICSPSRAGILTGKNPARLHITTFLPGRPDAPSQRLLHPQIAMQLPLEEMTLAEYLKEAGYATACIGKWHLGGAGFGPKEQGFDYVHAGQANTKPSATEGGKGEYDLTRHAVEFIEQNKNRPFFLYLPHNTPHIPQAAKPELVEKYKDSFNPVNAALMETLDDCVGIVLDKLKELKLDENTIVIFTSDNGGLHVLEFPGGPSTHNTPYRGGKGFLYEGGLREPAIVRWPGKIKPAVIDTPTVNLDWAPTLLTLAGLKIPVGIDGQDISPLLLGGKIDMPPRVFYWHFPHYNNQGGRPAGAVREGDWKYILSYDTGRVELYNLATDVAEEHDVAVDNGAVIARLEALRSDWLKSIDGQNNASNPNFDRTLFHKLYEEFDPSRPILRTTAAGMEEDMKEWRALMNEVVRGNRPAKAKAKQQ